MISRANIDDAVEGYIESLLSNGYGEDGISDNFGPGDIPKAALISIRRDVEAFLKRNERLLREASYKSYRGWPVQTWESPLLEAIGFGSVGGDFATVRNGDSVRFDDLAWRPDEITEKLDDAARAFPKTELFVGDPERERGEEPGRLYFWTEKIR